VSDGQWREAAVTKGEKRWWTIGEWGQAATMDDRSRGKRQEGGGTLGNRDAGQRTRKP
jgi:hypothetical protein